MIQFIDLKFTFIQDGRDMKVSKNLIYALFYYSEFFKVFVVSISSFIHMKRNSDSVTANSLVL